MKAMGTGLMVAAGIAAGMAVGGYFALSKPCIRRMYRYGKRATRKMIKMH